MLYKHHPKLEAYSWVSHINYNSYSYPDPATVTGMHWATGQALPTSLCEARRQLLGAPGIAGGAWLGGQRAAQHDFNGDRDTITLW